ncbi:MAG: 50S ribosomal protein L11 methyltransferase [Chlorobi bacterium]|nr:50S ribosomal protein L11 methyltransferase [Chlorobiota bacterium]
MKTHKQFNISASPFDPDVLSGLLWQLDIEGITENENSLSVYADEKSEVSVVQISDMLNSLKDQNMIASFSIDESSVEEKNWNEEWEKTIDVIEVNDKIVIKPTFRDYSPKPEQLVITIDPKMSFGTGEHETTKLVLNLLDKYIDKGISVLDVGSGTGVLSIAASLLGAEHVIGIDNDEWCLENGLENVELNKVNEKVEIKLAEIYDVDEEPFDLILANINKHILVDIADRIYQLTKNSGKAILSGLLIEDKTDITELYNSKGFSLVEEEILGEWVALVFQK